MFTFELKQDAQTSKLDKHWQFSVGSCHAPMAQRADYLAQLKFAHDELGVERVRFHGLFNDDMKVGMTLRNIVPLPSAGKYSEYSFFQIAKIFDNILATGVKPFIELGFMPKILASGKRQCTFEYKGNITMPKSLTAWGEFIGEFMDFIIDRYGIDEVSNWYFEVWNEPNLPVFFAGSKDDYFQLYDVTSRAVKKAAPLAKVGGPSTANCEWIDDFVQFCKKSGAPVDFVSTHQYAGDPIGHVFRPLALVNTYRRRIADMRKGSGTVLEGARKIFVDESEEITDRDVFFKNLDRLLPEAQGLPLYYTEWNVSATCTAAINDTRRAASYAVRTVLGTEGKVAGTSWWTFSDLFEEIQFFPQPFSGAFGMINNYGIPKPSFYAFKLLSLLGDEKYDTAVATEKSVECRFFDNDGKKQALVYKQNFIKEKGDGDICEIKAYVGEKPSAVTVRRIDEERCNPLAVWQKMGSPKYLKPNEVEDIKAKSALTEENWPFEYESGVATVRAELYNNDVWLIEFKK